MQPANTHQKLWIIPPLLYLLLLTAIIISQQYHLYPQQFIWFSSLFSFLTFAMGAFILWFVDKIEKNTTIDQQVSSKNPVKSTLKDYNRILNEMKEIFTALANGNLNRSITGKYSNDLTVCKTTCNDALNQLRMAIDDIFLATQPIDLTEKQGFLKQLSEQVNENNQLVQQINQSTQQHQELVTQLTTIFNAIAVGDFKQTLQADDGQLKQQLDTVLMILQQTLDEIKFVLDSPLSTKRIKLDTKQGDFKPLAQSINHYLDKNQYFIDEIKHVFSAVSLGDLKQKMLGDYTGDFDNAKQYINHSLDKVNANLAIINNTLDAMMQGVFEPIALENQQGIFLQTREHLNHYLQYNHQLLEQLIKIFVATTNGQFPQTLNGYEQGLFNELTHHIAHSTTCLHNLFEEFMHALSDKQFTQTVNYDYDGRLAELKNCFNNTFTGLNNMLAAVVQIYDNLDAVTSSVIQENEQYNQHVIQQIADLKNITAQTQILNQTAQQFVANNQHIVQLSNETCEQIEQGNNLIKQTVVAIDEINSTSLKVADIVSEISDMSLQINTVALNTTAEIVRLGDKGQGLAMIAMEIRQLAQRSIASARKMRTSIQDTLDKVDAGLILAEQSNAHLARIEVSAEKVCSGLNALEITSYEKSAAVLQLDNSITQLLENAQQHQNFAETLNIKIYQIHQQIKNLGDSLNYFKT